MPPGPGVHLMMPGMPPGKRSDLDLDLNPRD